MQDLARRHIAAHSEVYIRHFLESHLFPHGRLNVDQNSQPPCLSQTEGSKSDFSRAQWWDAPLPTWNSLFVEKVG